MYAVSAAVDWRVCHASGGRLFAEWVVEAAHSVPYFYHLHLSALKEIFFVVWLGGPPMTEHERDCVANSECDGTTAVFFINFIEIY